MYETLFILCLTPLVRKKCKKKKTEKSFVAVVQMVSTPGQTQTELESRFYFLLPQTAVLHGSDAISDSFEPASGFVIKNH